MPKISHSESTAHPAPPRRVTLQDIADDLGVCRMTVSLALRNSPRLLESTRLRVAEAAERMGYTTDPEMSRFMSYLRKRRPADYQPTIALLNAKKESCFDSRFFYLSQMAAGAAARAASTGYKIEEFHLPAQGISMRRLQTILNARSIQGLLVSSLPRGRGHLNFRWNLVSPASMTTSLWSPHLHTAAPDQFNHMLTTMREVFRFGYRRPGFFSDEDSELRSQHRWPAAFRWYLDKLPAHCPELLRIEKAPTKASFLNWVAEVRPDVIIVPVAEPCQTWLRQAGYSVPKTIGLASLVWVGECPDVSGVDNNCQQIGAAAVDLVVGQILRNETGLPDCPKLVQVPGKWVPGRTLLPQKRPARPKSRSRRPAIKSR